MEFDEIGRAKDDIGARPVEWIRRSGRKFCCCVWCHGLGCLNDRMRDVTGVIMRMPFPHVLRQHTHVSWLRAVVHVAIDPCSCFLVVQDGLGITESLSRMNQVTLTPAQSVGTHIVGMNTHRAEMSVFVRASVISVRESALTRLHRYLRV